MEKGFTYLRQNLSTACNKFTTKMFLWLWCVIFLCDSLKGQTISLHEYRQEESITNCTHGLVSDVDTIVFKATVDYSEDQNIQYVYFQIRTKDESDFLPLDEIDIKENCVVNKIVSCEHIDTYVVVITIRTIAKKEHSGARIRGVLITSDNEHITSDQQIFPEIADSTDITGKLFIDGLEIKKSNKSCVAFSVGPDVNFRFECESKVLPCLIQISEVDLMKVMEVKVYISHIFRQKQSNITIKQALCSLDHSYATITCNVKSDSNSSIANRESDNWKFSLFGLLGIPIAVFVIFLCMRKGNMIHSSKRTLKICGNIAIKFNFTKTKDEKKRKYTLAHDNGNTDVLLGESSSTPIDTSSQQDNINDNIPNGETAVYVEIHTIPMEKRMDLLHENKCMKAEKTKDLAQKQNSRGLEFLLDAVEKDTIFEKTKIMILPEPDEAFPFPDQTGIITLNITNKKKISFQMFAENDVNDKCKCRKCQDSQIPSTEWVQLILTEHDLDEDVSIDLSNPPVNSITHTHSQTDLKTSITKFIKTQVLVTCDEKLIDICQGVLNMWIDEWRKVSKKNV